MLLSISLPMFSFLPSGFWWDFFCLVLFCKCPFLQISNGNSHNNSLSFLLCFSDSWKGPHFPSPLKAFPCAASPMRFFFGFPFHYADAASVFQIFLPWWPFGIGSSCSCLSSFWFVIEKSPQTSSPHNWLYTVVFALHFTILHSKQTHPPYSIYPKFFSTMNFLIFQSVLYNTFVPCNIATWS